MAASEDWLRLADRVYDKGKSIFDQSHLAESPDGTRDPKVVALTLLARTIGNFEAALLLLENGLIVEARTITRCCYENLFWIAALAKRGTAFVEQMELDHAASKSKRARGLVAWSKAQDHQPEFVETLTALIDDLKSRSNAPSPINHKDAADKGGVGDAYIFYRELSTDAAHPSATSLSRHITWDDNEERFTLHGRPIEEAFAVEDTLELLCSSVLGVCAGCEEILEGLNAGEPFVELANEFNKLSGEAKLARDAIER